MINDSDFGVGAFLIREERLDLPKSSRLVSWVMIIGLSAAVLSSGGLGFYVLMGDELWLLFGVLLGACVLVSVQMLLPLAWVVAEQSIESPSWSKVPRAIAAAGLLVLMILPLQYFSREPKHFYLCLALSA